MRLPNYLIIGAQKAGTTSLHRYLSSHPNVSVSGRKEIHHFSRDQAPLHMYARHFAKAGPTEITGEASTSYSKEHQWPGTAARIAEAVPDVKLVYLLRDPVERIMSHHRHFIREGRDERPTSDILSNPKVDPDRNYLMTSKYAWQVSHYLEHFDHDQLLMITTEELEEKPEDTLQRVAVFLGLEDTTNFDMSVRYNTSDNYRKAPPELRARIAMMVQDDTAQLRGLLGREFHCWGLG